jgi:glycerol-3-phosphate dehydrogenase (NAD(P)+)
VARGRRTDDILSTTKMIAEGVRTTHAVLSLGARYGIELPIATQMDEVLSGRTDIRSALDALMVRPQRAEAEAG